MTRIASALIRTSLAATFAGIGLFWSGEAPLDPQRALISSAYARVGRPLTPVSYAGVARRTTRRAVAVGATAGAVYAAPGACVQAADAYGRIYTRCY
jgi:hypothetical protein